MFKRNKKSFDWYGLSQRFSIRKFHFGATSILLGTALVLGAATASLVPEVLGMDVLVASAAEVTPPDSPTWQPLPDSHRYYDNGSGLRYYFGNIGSNLRPENMFRPNLRFSGVAQGLTLNEPHIYNDKGIYSFLYHEVDGVLRYYDLSKEFFSEVAHYTNAAKETKIEGTVTLDETTYKLVLVTTPVDGGQIRQTYTLTHLSGPARKVGLVQAADVKLDADDNIPLISLGNGQGVGMVGKYFFLTYLLNVDSTNSGIDIYSKYLGDSVSNVITMFGTDPAAVPNSSHNHSLASLKTASSEIESRTDTAINFRYGASLLNSGSSRTFSYEIDMLSLPEKIVVKSSALTNNEKELVASAIKKANSSKSIRDINVEASGKATVSFANGSAITMEPSQTVHVFKKPRHVNVTNVLNLTESDKDSVKRAIENSAGKNNISSINVAEDGSTTVTFTSNEQLNLTPEQIIYSRPVRTLVQNIGNLTTEEKEKVKAAVQTANPHLASRTFSVSNSGVVFFGEIDLTISQDETVYGFEKPYYTRVENLDNLTEDEKAAVKRAIIFVNTSIGLKAEAVEVAADGSATISIDGEIITLAPNQTIYKVPNRIRVENVSDLTKEEREAVNAAIRTANPHFDSRAHISHGSSGESNIYNAGDTDKHIKMNVIYGFQKPSYTSVQDLNNLTEGEKSQIKGKIRGNNSSLPIQDITVAADGSVTIALTDGEIINLAPKETVYKLPILTPVQKIDNLTDEEKEAVASAIRTANPNSSKISVEQDGRASFWLADIKKGITLYPDYTVYSFSNPKYTRVQSQNSLTDEEKEAVASAIRTANPKLPFRDITIAADGSANITLTDGKILTLNSSVTVYRLPVLTLVQKMDNLTDTEKEAIETAIREANIHLSIRSITVNSSSTVLVLTDGTRFTYSPKQVFVGLRSIAYTPVQNKDNLTDSEKDAVKEAIRSADEYSHIQDILVASDGSATVTLKGGQIINFAQHQTVYQLPVRTIISDAFYPTNEDTDAITAAFRDANPDLPIDSSLGREGSYYITLMDGTQIEVPLDKIAYALRDIEFTPVQNRDDLTENEKAAVETAIRKVLPADRIQDITMAADGSTTIILTDGNRLSIPSNQLVYVSPIPTLVQNSSSLTNDEKMAVETAIRNANPDRIRMVSVGADGSASILFTNFKRANLTPNQTIYEERSTTPSINPVDTDDTTITGTGTPGATVTVTVPGQGEKTAVVGEDGNWTVSITPLEKDAVITATQEEAGKKASGAASTTVSANLDKSLVSQVLNNQKVLPKTGESTNLGLAFGLVGLVGVLGLASKKRED